MNSVHLCRRRMSAPWFAAVMAMSIVAGSPSTRAEASSSSSRPAVPAIFAKFDKSFSTRKAKVGDPITAKTVSTMRFKDLDIPKGSHLIGAVTAVQSKKEGNGDSSLAIRFSKIETKGNKVLPIEGMIVSIGELSNGTGFGPVNALSRGGVGSTNGVDPNLEIDKGATDSIPPGSSLPGVALGTNLSADGATELRGIKTDIKFDSDTEVKVVLFRSK